MTLEGPPLERTGRYTSPTRHKVSLQLADLDGQQMPPAAFYKTMSLDIVEGHQIGLYNADGSVKYPKHHTMLGSKEHIVASTTAVEERFVAIVRKRPASASVLGRTLSPRNLMSTSDIEGACPASKLKTKRCESNNMVTSDLEQKRRISPRLRHTSPLGGDGAARQQAAKSEVEVLQEKQEQVREAFYRHTTMHRPRDQGETRRPLSASAAGRSAFSDPLNPVYYVAAANKVSPFRHASPTKDSSGVHTLLMQSDGGENTIALCSSSALPNDAVNSLQPPNVVVSLPIHTKATPQHRKGQGVFNRDANNKSSSRVFFSQDDDSQLPSSDGPANSSPYAASWDKLGQCGDVSKHYVQPFTKRKCNDPCSEPVDGSDALLRRTGTSYLDYTDVPFGSSHWKGRITEARAQQKLRMKLATEDQERLDASQAMRKPRNTNPLVPRYRPLGASACSTAESIVDPDHTSQRELQETEAFLRTVSPPQLTRSTPRRLKEGEHTGVACGSDIPGSTSDEMWNRPVTASVLQRKVHRDVAQAQLLESQGTEHSAVLTGTSSGAQIKRGAMRPSSATVRSASTGAIPRDQQPQPEAAAPHKSRGGEISAFAEASQRFKILIDKSANDPSSGRMQLAVSAAKSKLYVRPPPHAASRKEVLHKKEIDSVRALPNFV